MEELKPPFIPTLILGSSFRPFFIPCAVTNRAGSNKAINKRPSFIEDYSCRYSSGFTPDSLASAGGYAFPIANSGSKDKDFYTLFCLLFLIILVFLYLCPPNRFRTDVSAVRIKREPGVNPGQSRCCEAPSNEVLIRTFATDMRLYIGKASR